MLKGKARVSPENELKIVADFIDTNNYTKAGERNKVSNKTAKRKVEKYKDLVDKVNRKSDIEWIEEYLYNLHEKENKVLNNTLDITLEHQEDRSISDADNIRIYGIILDKWLKKLEVKNQEKMINEIEDLSTLADMLGFNKKDSK